MRKKKFEKKSAKTAVTPFNPRKDALERCKNLLTVHGVTLVGVAYLDHATEVVLINAAPAHVFGAVPVLSQVQNQLAQTPPGTFQKAAPAAGAVQ